MNVEIWETEEWRNRIGLFLAQYLQVEALMDYGVFIPQEYCEVLR